MSRQTTNYGLTKPDYTDTADIEVVNSNMDIIDEALKVINTKSNNVMSKNSSAWSSTVAYAVGQYCIYNNSLWKSLVQHSGQTPQEGTYWARVSLDTLGSEINALNSNIENIHIEITTNLLKSTLETTVINGVTCTNNGDGTYTLNGTATGLCLFNVGIFSLKKGTYMLVGCPKGGNTSKFYLDCRKNTTEQALDTGSGGVFTTDDEKDVLSKIIVRSGVTVNNVLFKPMITTDLSATYDDFVPYTGSTGSINGDVAELNRNITNLITIRGYSLDTISFTSANQTKEIEFDIATAEKPICVLDLIFSSPTVGVQYINYCRFGATNKFRLFSSVAQDIQINVLVLCYK